MNFEPTEERRMLAETLRRYLRDHYGAERWARAEDLPQGFDPEVWAEMAELGVVGALLPEDVGGFGGAGFDLATVFEELGRAGVVEPFLETAVLGAGLVAALGDEAQREGLAEVVEGRRHLAFAHTEPRSRYDLSRVTTEAKGGRLTGRKSVVENAEAAGHLIVSAREGGGEADEDGISLFLVPADAEGVTLRGYAPDGRRAGGRGHARRRAGGAARAGGRRVPGHRGAGRGGGRGALGLRVGRDGGRDGDDGRLSRTAAAVRPPAGGVPGAPAPRGGHADRAGAGALAVILAAGHLEDERTGRERHASAAKHLIGRVGRLIAEESIQLHGGIGMTREYGIGHLAKRITLVDHRLGDTDHHLERFIALSAA